MVEVSGFSSFISWLISRAFSGLLSVTCLTLAASCFDLAAASSVVQAAWAQSGDSRMRQAPRTQGIFMA
ncbi:hypothetical protein D9M73_293670 [compost metagenome]